jgi:hypothetical protein
MPGIHAAYATIILARTARSSWHVPGRAQPQDESEFRSHRTPRE